MIPAYTTVRLKEHDEHAGRIGKVLASTDDQTTIELDATAELDAVQLTVPTAELEVLR